MRLYWIRVGSKSDVTDVFIIGNLNTETQTLRGERHVKRMFGVMHLQAKDCQQPPKVRKGKEEFFPGSFRGKMALLTP